MINVTPLFSGSDGNSIYINDGKSEILIDAGKSAGAIDKALKALGTSLSNISAIFLTHEHSDHTSALEIISKKFAIPVHITDPSYKKLVHIGSFLSSCAVCHDVNYEVSVGDFKISSFEIPHDSVQNVGYIFKNNGEKFGIATDMGHITDEIKMRLCGCSSVIIESNHDRFMLVAGHYPEFLKHRILSDTGHLCNEECAHLACYLAENGTKSITLAHLSKENNTPDMAFSVTRQALDENGFCSVELNIAR